MSVWPMCPHQAKGLRLLLPSPCGEGYSRTHSRPGFWEGLPRVRCLGVDKGVLLEEAPGPLWAFRPFP